MRTAIFALFGVLTLSACGGVADSAPETRSEFSVKLVPVIEEAEFPWGMAFLPNGDLLFTEKDNGLKISAGASATPVAISRLPEARTVRQGGYLGLTLDPDFAENRRLYLSYSKALPDGTGTAVIRARLSDDSSRLENVTEIFVADARPTDLHYGSRLQFLGDGTLVVSLGEGFKLMDEAQNPKTTHGSIVRINPDGSIPADNPYADGVSGNKAVWSIGHRNVQGLYYDADTDTLYETEHGPKGGDELNIIRRGNNYGWPKITYGVNYDGTILSKYTEMEGMQQPETYWVPSIAPSGLTMLKSDVYPGWKGDLFAGGMNGPDGLKLVRIDIENGKVVARENVLDGDYPIRDVIEGPDGHLYVATKDLDGIFRLDIAE